MTTLDQTIASLPEARQAKIEARASELVAEALALRELREAQARTRAKLGRTLGLGQAGVSRLEQRSDLPVSTLRDAVATIGGRRRGWLRRLSAALGASGPQHDGRARAADVLSARLKQRPRPVN